MSSPLPFLLFLLSVLLLPSSTFAQVNCYSRALNTIINDKTGWIACSGTAISEGGALSCCLPGSECGPDGLCHNEPSAIVGNNTWYIAGCTDGTYQDPVCRLNCTDYLQTYIQWDATTNLWACCGGNGCNGSYVTDETFSAIAPSSWTAISTAASFTQTGTIQISTSSSVSTSSSSSSSIATTSSTTSPSSTSAAPAATSSNANGGGGGGLSTGAKAGIGVAVGLGGLALIAAVAAILLWRRSTKKNGAQKTADEHRVEDDAEKTVPTTSSGMPPPHYTPTAEMDTEPQHSELPATEREVHELGGGKDRPAFNGQ